MQENLTPAGFGKRFLSYILDLAIILMPAFIAWQLSATSVINSWGGGTTLQEMYAFAADSGLYKMTMKDGSYTGMSALGYSASSYVTTSSGSEVRQDQDGYDLYLNACYLSYTTFFHNDERIGRVTVKGVTYAPAEYYTATRFDTEKMGLPDPAKVSDVSVEANISSTSGYWKYDVRSGESDLSLALARTPVLTSAMASKVAARDTDTLTSLNNFFFKSSSTSYSGVYYELAYQVQSGEPYYIARSNVYTTEIWGVFAIYALTIGWICLFVVPLLFKNGQTLGKKITGLGLVNSDGYRLRWWPGHILHPFLVALISSVGIAIPWTYLSPLVSVMVFAAAALIDYFGVFVFKETRQSFTDKLSRTIVIDLKASTVYGGPDDVPAPTPNSLGKTSSFFDTTAPASPASDYESGGIVDSSTIGLHQREADAITSFDDFEKNGVKSPSDPKEDAPKDSKGIEKDTK